MLPGWNSFETASRYYAILDVSGIVCLCLGVLFELCGFFAKRDGLKRGLELVGILFFLLLVGAEYGEHRYRTRVDELAQQDEKRVTKSQEEKIRQLQSALQKQESEANSVIARLAKVAGDAAPRRLTAAEQRSVTEALTRFRGQKFTIDCVPGNAEAFALAFQLLGVLQNAGWRQLVMAPGPSSLGLSGVLSAQMFAGVVYFIGSAASEGPAKALRTQLQQNTVYITGIADRSIPPDIIEIWVGGKPLPRN
ncbi:MAG TPA: hypothetical protein VJN90_07080 [Candidatus Acidoferrales bacterium]|nr:hypothetical protein [Candidatus Acidoferrales bacterium]